MNKIFFGFVIFVICGVAASYISLPLPPGITPVSEAYGKIDDCEISNRTGGKSSPSLLFVGITLAQGQAPYLRWNPPKSALEEVRSMCLDKSLVKVKYSAKRTLLRPKLSFWIERIEKVRHNH